MMCRWGSRLAVGFVLFPSLAAAATITVGLTGGEDRPDGGRSYPCGGGTSIHVYPSAQAGGSGSTAAAWDVDDVDRTVDELTGRGLQFERYDEPFATDEKGIARLGDAAVAWFKDPDGNVLAIGSG